MVEQNLEQSAYNERLYKSREHQEWAEGAIKKGTIAYCRFSDGEACEPNTCGKGMSYNCFEYYKQHM